jgi:hypothetical protein
VYVLTSQKGGVRDSEDGFLWLQWCNEVKKKNLNKDAVGLE